MALGGALRAELQRVAYEVAPEANGLRKQLIKAEGLLALRALRQDDPSAMQTALERLRNIRGKEPHHERY